MQTIYAIIPAAGVGSRMQADKPKQYLTLQGKTILEHTAALFLQRDDIKEVIIAISPDDPYFDALSLSQHPKVVRVTGGKERADTVLSALQYIDSKEQGNAWVMVHDAARPCLQQDDINRLKAAALSHSVGGILAAPVRDTMKRGNSAQGIDHTVDRENLWHALTPQLFPINSLKTCLEQALKQGYQVTDEASALEFAGYAPELVTGRADNIKITRPEDLALAQFYLMNQSPNQE
ncbi:2-C-methyl-D-erythritol 4-phosphate cytidylyltransferase [Vibrio agarivorans]|uniref:2-C-methyl-D-erythritol 4-phosphate cytidylyltransferase n=1 Tax=Vibrio agarivorans TaxID=153622 RepID=A0ABT7XXD2_9VIBR|nr:2-C-methyl-D-erythritol 4-phosphate cytidylyltransferase [Vibrio agarivorans]MDN2480199.1 2-C-methyl-D-erythritol 4-phosphate cytidylyltransferase [Vibrio agarivorans]